MRSTSRFTLLPLRRFFKLVSWRVWGMSSTLKLLFVSLVIVRLTPLMVIDPLRARYLAIFLGWRISRVALLFFCSSLLIVPTQSMWPWTMCPSRP